MSLQGNLATFSLDEVLQLLAETAKTGTLHVSGPGVDGAVHLADGDLCGADVRHVEGGAPRPGGLAARVLDVCFAFGRLDDGSFEFETAPAGAAAPVLDALPVAVLLGRLRPLLEEWPAISRVVPSFDVRPSLTKELVDDVVTIDRASWSVLVVVDGTRSVRDLAVELDRSAAEVAATLRTLVTAGAVTLGADAPTTLTLVPLPEPEAALDVDIAVEVDVAVEPEADVVVVSGPELPGLPTEGPDVLARLDRAELERAALGEPVDEDDPADDLVDDLAVEVIDADGDLEGDDTDPDGPHPAVPRDRGALLRMFSALRDG